MLLEVRVGDAFITDVTKFAQGVLFAVDSGASVVQEALGTLNNATVAQRAVEYAYERGVVVMASAADEESAHNNYPANYSHTVQVNSVVKFFDEGGITQAPKVVPLPERLPPTLTATSPSPCPRRRVPRSDRPVLWHGWSVVLRGPQRDRRRHARAVSGGTTPLSAEEVKQLLIHTADDINFDARPDLDRRGYKTTVPICRCPGSSRPARASRRSKVRPVLRLRPHQRERRGAACARRAHSAGGSDRVAGVARISVAAQRGDRHRRSRCRTAGPVVPVHRRGGPGVQQAEAAFVEVFRRMNTPADVDGVLARLDLNQVAALLPSGVSGPPVLDDGSLRGDPDRFAFTVRVRVTDDGGQRGEDRRTSTCTTTRNWWPASP